jgi:nucleotide-binding universal stress UspA family protein
MLILLPVDGSELALDAVHHALRLVQAGLQANFVLANVQEPTHLYEVVLAPNAELLEAASDEAGAHALTAGEALLTAAGARFEREIAHGDPGQTVLEIAERFGVDAIILGTRGAGSLRSALLGSVSQTVLHGATVPVTIVKHADPSSALADDTADTAS